MIPNQIDWCEVWKNQMVLHIEQRRGKDCADNWKDEKEANNYWEQVQENRDWTDKIIEDLNITRESRILDIGAGPGTLAIPLANKIANVTAVEPSDAMMKVLRRNLEKKEYSNVDCVKKLWEDVDVKKDLHSPYDVVIASYSLGMIDIKESIQKMIDASSKYVYLYWFAGETSWHKHRQNLWAMLHEGKSPLIPMPMGDVLFNSLYQMGIYPNVEIFPTQYPNRFSSMEEAVNRFKSEYEVFTPKQEADLRSYLKKVLETDGHNLIIRNSALSMKIWWTVDI